MTNYGYTAEFDTDAEFDCDWVEQALTEALVRALTAVIPESVFMRGAQLRKGGGEEVVGSVFVAEPDAASAE